MSIDVFIQVKRDVLRLVRSFVDSAVAEQDRMKAAHMQLAGKLCIFVELQ